MNRSLHLSDTIIQRRIVEQHVIDPCSTVYVDVLAIQFGGSIGIVVAIVLAVSPSATDIKF